MILLMDNYDSFTYNLYQYIGEITEPVKVVRNDKITLREIEELSPDALILSPGPGYPAAAGIMEECIRYFAGKMPILGICLGHQGIGEAFGGKVIHAAKPIHGKVRNVAANSGCPLFSGLPDKFPVARYHSLVLDKESLPAELQIVAQSEDGEIMGIMHKNYEIYGLQFHPESIMTRDGKQILRNFIGRIKTLSIQKEKKTQILSSEEDRDLKPFLQKIIDAVDLEAKEAEDAMDQIMNGNATPAQIGSFLTALRMKGETIDEITGFARSMRKKASRISSEKALDIVGTGGDMANTFNISTTAAFVAAGAGVTVAKHGNRGVSSSSGSADLLEALGVNIDCSPAEAQECLNTDSLTFLFAPCFHKTMKHAAAPRKEIGVRSVFNILGPLANPASAEYMLLGVYDEKLMEVMAHVLINLGIAGALIVHGCDGLDEISTTGPTKICEIDGGKLIKYEIFPESYGFNRAQKSDLKGGSPQENAKTTLAILSGEKGPKRDIVVLNAAAAIYAARKVNSIEEGILLAEESIDSGRAVGKLRDLANFPGIVRRSRQ